MVGEGVLHECLNHNEVEAVLVIGRKPCGLSHPKLTEILHADFHNITPIESQLAGYNSCYFCLGVSSVGMQEEKFHDLTYNLTNHVAEKLALLNPGMVFCYVSGSGTDSSEKGRTMWARVKGKTENRIIHLFGKGGYAFRPGYLHPTKGLKNTLKGYKWIGWMYPMLAFLFPGYVCSLADLGRSMIQTSLSGYPTQILEVKDIVSQAKALTQA